MGHIYSNAKQVLISLSSEKDPTGGLGWLNQFSQYSPTELRSAPELGKDDPYDSAQTVSEVKDFHLGWDAFIATVLSSPW
jgi:hypothetical protein